MAAIIKYTPGPWHHGTLSDEIITAKGEAICAPPSDYDEATWQANARLIKEAPAMHAQLTMLATIIEDGVTPLPDGRIVRDIRTLIARIDKEEVTNG